jgi:polygalacturonase
MSRRNFLANLVAVAARPRLAVAALPIIDAGKFGLIGDGRTDVTQALNAAANAVPQHGGVLTLPPGDYRVTGPVILKSGTVLTGPGATIMGFDEAQHPTSKRMLVTNANADAATAIDGDITVRDIAFQYVGDQLGDAHAIQFRKANHLLVENCRFSGGGNGTAFLACQNTEVAHCVSQGTLNCAYDHWEGSSDCLVHDCVAICGRNYGILFTGVGTQQSDNQHARRVSAINNRIESPTQAGIWICSLSAHSSVSEVTLQGNHVSGGSSSTSGIGASGDVSRILIEDNTLENIQGGPGIFVRADQWNRPRHTRIVANHLINCQTDSKNVALIQALGDDVEVVRNRVRGGRFPDLIWSDGKNVTLGDNSASGAVFGHKYVVEKADHPIISDP